MLVVFPMPEELLDRAAAAVVLHHADDVSAAIRSFGAGRLVIIGRVMRLGRAPWKPYAMLEATHEPQESQEVHERFAMGIPAASLV
jgi:hypothetical protein